MQVDSGDIDSAVTGLGFRIAVEREMDGPVIRPRLKALWKHEWGDTDREVSGRFAGGGGRLDLEGAEVPRDLAEISVGWEVGYVTNANLFIDWNGRFGSDLIENAIAIGVRAAW